MRRLPFNRSFFLLFLVSTVLASCAVSKKEEKVDFSSVLFDNLKPYIGVGAGNTLKEVMIDVYVRHRDAILSVRPELAQKMHFSNEPRFGEPFLVLEEDSSLVGYLRYYRDVVSYGKTSVTRNYYISYNFFTGDTHSILSGRKVTVLSYTKFLVEPDRQLDYMAKVHTYLQNLKKEREEKANEDQVDEEQTNQEDLVKL